MNRKLSIETGTSDLHGFLLARFPDIRGSREDADNGRGTVENLWRGGKATGAELADAIAEFHTLPRTSFEQVSRCPAAFRDMSVRYLRQAHAFPYMLDGRLAVAVADPSRIDIIQALALALGARPELHVASFEDIELLFERSKEAPVQDQASLVADTDLGAADKDTAESLQDLAQGAPVVRVIDQILERAVDLGATDIHLETEREHVRVRYRVDGFLRREHKLPLGLAPAVISRVKILAGLDIAERRLPQDGRANLRIGNIEADIRVAVMPTMYGETAVLRILLRDSRLLDLGRIGMSDADRARFEALLSEPHGIVIVTGPTGSGKTTTLATAISMLNDPARKLVTVEDPIEYQIGGVHQTQIKPSIGLTFASALRSFLRHDPDVIMVGEMRDRETASIGVQAALTGHLVLTTLHTNSASDAIVRLIDMGVEPYLLGASLRGVIGQRLVRKLCERCRRPDDEAADRADALAEARGLAHHAPDGGYFSAQGCEACENTGYRGRIGIFEIMRADEPLRAVVREDPDPASILGLARSRGMTMMVEDGLRKCAQGLTSLDEVVRATG